MDSARGREPGTPGLREGRKVGARGAGAPLPGPALATPAGPQPRIRARFSRRPRPTLEVGFQNSRGEVIGFYVEDYLQSSSPGKKVFAGVAFAKCEEAFLLILLSVCTASLQVIIKSLQTL